MVDKVKRNCKWCEKEFKLYQSQVDNGGGSYCSRSCRNKHIGYLKKQKAIKKAKNNPLSWNKNIAYLVGLITSDGSLRNNIPRVSLTNTDKIMIEQAKEIIEKHIDKEVKITYQDRKENWKRSYKFEIYSRRLYFFMKNLGLTPNKSKTLPKLDIPDKYYNDFLRGVIDGDGTITTRTVQNKYKYLRVYITCASKDFLEWIDEQNKKLFNTKGGSLYKKTHGKGIAYRLEYGSKNDTKNIVSNIYNNDTEYYLPRKREVVSNFPKP